MKRPFTIYDLRFTIWEKSAKPSSQSVSLRAPAIDNRQSSIINHKSKEGVALIITLILLGVVTFMAVAFLALSRRERGAVTTVTDTASARLAADAALASAEAQIVANVLSTTNPYNFGLLVSTNYINPNGFVSGVSSFTNVSYYDSHGNFLTGDSFLQNLTNLWYSPRPPVFIVTNQLTGGNDFRYYLDLNRNGRYDTNGFVLETNFFGQAGINFEVGDPEWIGILQRPDQPYGPNNPFVARYAFIAVPVGNTLDLNAIHNQAMTRELDVANDGYFRNQGVGSWEINLAAFLTDLDPNQWDTSTDPYIYQRWIQPNPGIRNTGRGFEDALALLSYRYYTNYYGTLARVNGLYPLSTAAFQNNIDGYSDWTLMTTPAGIDVSRQDVTLPWAGADNTNHFFTPEELFNSNEISALFVNSLLAAGNTNSIYENYTFYRLLSQLGTDTTPESGKMNLNYQNVDTNGNVVPGMETNFICWTNALAFFTNAADRLLRAYTTEWRNNNLTNFAATFYSVSDFTFTNNPGNWTNYPAFGIGHIPVLVSNQFVYSSAVNRLLQLAANIYDATTNNTAAMGNNYPSVFRPLFIVDKDPFHTNVFISGYTNVVPLVSGLSDWQLAQPIDASVLAAMSGVVTNLAVNVYGVPWIIGAKKGFPNFNEFTMQNVVEVVRKLQVKRPTLTGPITTNQMYIFSVSNSLGAELWNSYNSSYVSANLPSIQVLVRDNISMVLTNDALGFSKPQIINGGFTNTFSTNLWAGSAPWNQDPYTGLPQANSFFIPLNPTVSTVVLLTNSVYYYGPGSYTPPSGGSYNAPCFIPQYLEPSNYLDTGISQLPHFGLLTTNRLQVVILDGNYVIDYAHFAGPNSSRDLNAELQDPYSVGDPAYMWNTNGYMNGTTPYGVVDQINYCRGLPNVTLPSNNGGVWDPAWSPLEQPFFDAFFYQGHAKQLSPPINGQSTVVNTNLFQQAPFSPVRIIYEFISWQANDPLVHYLASDLYYFGQDTQPPTGTNQWNSTTSPLPRPTYGILNNRYQPWGRTHMSTNSDPNPCNFAFKDPLIWQSDNWDFPASKFPTVGWLGRVHRGTPWQTVYLKATNVLAFVDTSSPVSEINGLGTWVQWTGDTQLTYGQYFDAANTAPVRDRLLFDLFTTAFNDNATRGTLSVNVGPTNANLAAWSALFSGVIVLSNNASDAALTTYPPPSSPQFTAFPIDPAGSAGLASALGQLVNGINQTRANTNLFPLQSFAHVGDILAVPQLTEQSPFLNWNDSFQRTNGISDEMYEWLPQQTMSLLRCSSSPRYVIYCYGQTLKPAPDSIVASGTYFGMITNYQIVSEIATRAVVRFNAAVTNVITYGPTYNNWYSVPVVTNNNAVIESFNILPPD
jgi:hypothetical protein